MNIKKICAMKKIKNPYLLNNKALSTNYYEEYMHN